MALQHLRLGNSETAKDVVEEVLELTDDYPSIQQLSDAISLYDTGINFLNDRQHNDAIDKLKKAIDKESTFTEAYYWLGYIHFQNGVLKTADQFANDTLKLYTSHQLALTLLDDINQAYYKQACDYLNNRQYDRAISEFSKLIKRDPNFIDAYCTLGRAYLGQSELRGAENSAKEALRLDENYQPALELRETIAQKHYELARDYFNQDNLAAAVISVKETLRLTTDYQPALRLLEGIRQAYYKCGLNHLNNLQYDAAIAAFEETINRYPQFIAAHCGLGQAHLAQENLVLAENSVKEALRHRNDYRPALQLLENIQQKHCERGRDYFSQNELITAEESVEKALRLDDNYQPARELQEAIGKAYYNSGINYITHGAYTDAVKYLQKAKGIHPNDKNVYTHLGIAYYWMDDHDNAAICCQKVTIIDPDNKYAYINLGNSYYRMGAYKNAINSLQKAKELDPNYEKTCYYLARAYFGIGKLEKAKREIGQALGNTRAYKLLQTVEQEMYDRNKDNSQMIVILTDESEIDFRMDKNPVTNAQYKKFLNENPQWCKDNIEKDYHDGHYLEKWKGNSYPIGEASSPVVYVSWYAAMAYAQWAGKRLPTKTQWKEVARGGYDLPDMCREIWEWCLNTSDLCPIKNTTGSTSNFSNIREGRFLCGDTWERRRRGEPPAEEKKSMDFTNGPIGFRCVRPIIA